MAKIQSWESCRYHLGNLDINLEEIAKTNSTVRLWLAVIPMEKTSGLFSKEGVNETYYCTNKKLVELRTYSTDELASKNNSYTPVARLFRADVSDGQVDWFGEDRNSLENAIKKGLRMCGHCKFYKPA
jgi:hypothetical protein